MSSIRTILAATDFSQDGLRAARRAARLARAQSARLQLVHVLRADLLATLTAHLRGTSGIDSTLLDQARQRMQDLCAELEPLAGSRPEASVRSGNVLDEVLAAADEADVMVLGAHGLSALHDQLLGTTAERLLRRSRRPMIVVRQDPAMDYARVLVPIDFSLPSIGALEFAQELAPDAELHLLHAYESPYEGKLRQADVSEEAIRQLRQEFRDEASANMANVLEKWVRRTTRAITSLESGNPKLLIPQRAQARGIDLVVIGKHGHSALGEYFLGGVTRHALSQVACDVAIVPDRPKL